MIMKMFRARRQLPIFLIAISNLFKILKCRQPVEARAFLREG